MKCPKCKSEVSPNDLICPTCKLKLMITCPRCKSLSRLGSSLCQKCGFVFVKFCPKCNSANYASATHCRKCFYELPNVEEAKKVEDNNLKEEINEQKQNIQEKKVEEIKETQPQPQPQLKMEQVELQSNPAKDKIKQKIKEKVQNVTPKLVVMVDFISLKNIFEKYKDEEFEQKVLLNIRAAIRIGFNAECDFIKPNVACFKTNYVRKIGFLSKANKFKEEIAKLNNILAEILGANISYKFAITTEEEFKENKNIEQLEHGIEKDIIVSCNAYKILNDEISLIKISNNSYKMVFLDQKPVFTQNETTNTQDAVALIKDAINNASSEIKAISVSAPRGFGKTHLLESLQEQLEEDQNVILMGQCTPLTQVTPMGLFQDIFLSLFRLTFAPSKYEERVKDVRDYLLKNLPIDATKNSDIVDNLINIIYPIKEDFYENIFQNKQKTFQDIKTILELLRGDNKLVLIIDDFDLVDESSFEFLKYLIQNDFLETSKLLLLYKNQHAIEMYIQSEKLPKNACLNINLAAKDNDYVKKYIKEKFNEEKVLPDEILNQILAYGQGNFAYIEQALHYLKDTNKICLEDGKYYFDENYIDECIPQTLDEILDLRCNILKEHYEQEYNLLSLSSLLGGRFNKSALAKVLNLEEDDFNKIANKLIDKCFIKKVSLNSYVFKNNLVWSYIYDRAKNDESMRELQNEFLNEICKRKISSPAIKALLAQTTENKDLAFNLWTQNLKYASYIGDVNLYILSQKQSLSLLENAMISNKPYVKNNICERVGKLIYEKNPKEAIDYLSNAVIWAKEKGDENKVIELSGYLIQSCKITQNYPAIIETVDNILELFNKQKCDFQRALIKTRKLNALLKIGNWEEIINLVNNEINPVLQEYFKHPKNYDYISILDVYKTWLSANVTLAHSYAQQGSCLAFTLIEELEKEIFKDKNKNIDLLHTKLQLAFATATAYTIKGITKISDDILQSVVKDFSYAIEEPAIVSEWNFINLVNKIMKHDMENIKNELFEAVAFANNNNDENSKNLLKILLAFVLLEESDNLKALEICDQQMSYFTSKQRTTLGALLSWYVGAKASLQLNDSERCIKICEKSIKICKDSRKNSIYFNILFNKLLAQAYLKQSDIESAKMYTELALQEAIAQENDGLQIDLLSLRAKCLEETLPLLNSEKQSEIAQKIIKIYEKAISIANKINANKKHYIAQKNLTAFKAHCQLKEIE